MIPLVMADALLGLHNYKTVSFKKSWSILGEVHSLLKSLTHVALGKVSKLLKKK